MRRAATSETKRALGFLRELCDAVLLHLRDLDAAMKLPSVERGNNLGRLANRLEWANDRCRYFGLGIDFRSDPQSKVREAALAEYLDPWTERAACAELVRVAGCICGDLRRGRFLMRTADREAYGRGETVHDPRCPIALAEAITARHGGLSQGGTMDDTPQTPEQQTAGEQESQHEQETVETPAANENDTDDCA